MVDNINNIWYIDSSNDYKYPMLIGNINSHDIKVIIKTAGVQSVAGENADSGGSVESKQGYFYIESGTRYEIGKDYFNDSYTDIPNDYYTVIRYLKVEHLKSNTITITANANYHIDENMEIEDALITLGLPTKTDYDSQLLADLTLSDKKSSGNTIKLIIFMRQEKKQLP